MLSNIRTLIRPASVEDAVRYLAEAQGALKVMAGGTAGAVFKSRDVNGVVDLWSLPLRYVAADADRLRLGATATLGDVVRSPQARHWAGGALWEAARSAGSTPLRNLITVGGNVAGLYPWSDLPPALLVLDAVVRIAGAAGPERHVADLVVRHPSKMLGDASIITEIVVPDPGGSAAAAFFKFAESAVAYSWLDVAALVEMDGPRCRRCRLAVGAIEARPRRLPEVEERVTGEELVESAARAAGAVAAQAVRPMPDVRVGEAYRRELLETLTRRALLEARDRAWVRAQGGVA